MKWKWAFISYSGGAPLFYDADDELVFFLAFHYLLYPSC